MVTSERMEVGPRAMYQEGNMSKLLIRTDKKVSFLSEDLARKLSRKQLMVRGVKGFAAVAAGASVGSLVRVKDAFAANCTCSCDYPGCGNCSCRGKICPNNGCPSGCTLCKAGDCDSCPYSNASWVCCTGCGVCGLGWYVCYDCKCPGCGSLCGCKTDCRCSGCCSPAEVKAEMAKDLVGEPVAAKV